MAPKNHYGRFGPFGSRLEKIDKKGKPVVYIRSHTLSMTATFGLFYPLPPLTAK